MRKFPKLHVYISGSAFLTGAALVLLLPLRWLVAALLAAAFHEACHYMVAWLWGGRPGAFCVGSRGAVLNMPQMSRGRELVCALAGPLGGLFLAAFYRQAPRLAVCALVQTVFNLLPLYPMDGGRALDCIAALMLPLNWADRVVRYARWCCLFFLFSLGVYCLLVLKLGIFAFLPWTVLVLRKNSLQCGKKTSTIKKPTV